MSRLIFGAEIGIAIWGILTLLVGIRGKPARLPAIVALLPWPLSIVTGVIVGVTFPQCKFN